MWEVVVGSWKGVVQGGCTVLCKFGGNEFLTSDSLDRNTVTGEKTR